MWLGAICFYVYNVPQLFTHGLIPAGGPNGDVRVCGATTSGGTESILSAVKSARDYARATRGVRAPELVIGSSAHAAYHKAAEYFGLRLVTARTLLSVFGKLNTALYLSQGQPCH